MNSYLKTWCASWLTSHFLSSCPDEMREYVHQDQEPTTRHILLTPLSSALDRKAGYACCFWLIIMGIFAKFASALTAIPSAVLGGMTTFLFAAVASSGIRIISTMPFTRRNRFILTASLALGLGATLLPTWFAYVFTYEGPNRALIGFFNAIELVMETGFAICGIAALILNLILPEEDEDEDVPELTANNADDNDDREEWDRINVERYAKGEEQGARP